MRKWSFLTRAVPLFPAVLITACIGPPAPVETAGTGTSGRYAMEDDSPALEPFDLARVKPVVPVPEERTLAGNKSPYTVNGRTYTVLASEAGYAAVGGASWYGRKFHGHLTSNGEVYDMFQLSAAHRSLPIPSYVRVTNLDNQREIVVRINDRGPFHSDRIIDLSYAAATVLGYAEQGTARVKVEAITPGRRPQTLQSRPLLADNDARGGSAAAERQAPREGAEFLQVGAFSSLDIARGLLARLADITAVPAVIHSGAGLAAGQTLHRVRLGPLTETTDLNSLMQAIVDADLGKPFMVTE